MRKYEGALWYEGEYEHEPYEWHAQRLRNLPRSTISVDTETISTKDKTCLGIGIGLSEVEAYYIGVLPDTSPMLAAAYGLVASPTRTKIYHNANFDLEVLRLMHDLDDTLPDPDVWEYQDTATLAHVSGRRAALDVVAGEAGVTGLFTIADVLADTRERVGKSRVTMLDADPDRLARKCINDVRSTWAISNYLRGKTSTKQLDCYEVDRRCLSILKTIERRGFGVDHSVLQQHHERLSRDITLYRDLCDQQGFQPGSNQQVGYILASRGNILPFTKSRRQLRTDDETLSRLDDPLAHLVLAYRRATKLLSTYVSPWMESERAFTHFRLDLSTGRLASYDRNLQNIPESMRGVFESDGAGFTWADISQLEMRVYAYMTQDATMLEAYSSGKDIHTITHEGLFSHMGAEGRKPAKTFNFAMIYDAMDKTLSLRTGLPIEAAAKYKAQWLALYSGAAKWMRMQAEADVEVVEDIYGRAMMLPEYAVDPLTGRDNQKHINTCKINYPVQGSGANIVKRGINYLWDHGYGDAYRLQVHDEHVFDGDVEFPKAELDNLCDLVPTPHEVKHAMRWT